MEDLRMRSLFPFSSGKNTPTTVGQPDDPFSTLHRQIDRLFEDFGRWPAFEGFRASSSPRINVSETDSSLEIEAELPGLDEKDVEVILNEDVLTIKGEKKDEREEKKKDFHVMERSYGSFSRSIRLPYDFDPDAINASFAKGVLKITLPKPAEAKQKTVKIPIKNG
jgi:HSP20 family protein